MLSQSNMNVGLGLWGVVLAGGEGVRLRALARRVYGDERPKQYVPVFADRTLLRQTLDRVALEIRPSQTAVTAAGILLPIQWVSRQDPGATVAIFPADHFVSEPAAFMAHVTQTAAWVDEHPDRLVLLGARATSPEVEYGWIEIGKPLDSTQGRRVWEIRRFWEKPSEERARACLEAGCLWNTLVLVGKAATFLRAGKEAVPDVCERLARAVAALPRLTWSDLGSPARVFAVLRGAQNPPAWLLASSLAAS